MAKSIKEKRAKKRWFPVLAPAIFNQKQLPEITAFEPNELVGRKIELSLKEFTGNPKDSFKKIVCKITKVQGDTAHTEVDRYFVLDSYAQRTSKKYPSSVLVVSKVKTKDDKQVKVKAILFLKNRIQRKTKTDLAKLMEKTIEAQVSKKNIQEIFSPQFISTLFVSSKKQMNKIYPVASIFVWKLTLV